MEQGRGMLTPRVKDRSKELFGYEVNVRQLRLMPYIQYTMCNSQRIDPSKISAEERQVLSQWRKEGHIEGGASGMRITKDFWDKINDLIFLAYVDID